ncbi:unnamed protein product, partial [Vitis vinifera]
MGTGWRRAFCTTIHRDSQATHGDKQRHTTPSPSPSPRSGTKLGLFSSGSNTSTPRLQSQPVSSPSLRCRTTVAAAQTPSIDESPKLQAKTTTPTGTAKTPRSLLGSNPSSPRSPLKLSIFRNSFKLRNSCGICLQSVKTGQGTAIYTAECSHAFHFSCIAAHVRKQGSLVCPVCNTTWKDEPLLMIHKNRKPEEDEQIKAADFRTYDDDEPLLSPTSGGRFIPIPEADENGGDDEEEIEEMLQEAAVVSVGRSHETYAVALRIKAPPPPHHYARTAPFLDPARRAPIDLVTVLDVSASMTGSKLQMLKRAMRLVISSLGPSDRLAIVAFSASPRRLLPLRRMTAHGQRSARRIIDRLVCSQGSSVGEALRKATKVLEDRRERNPVASIMLLSDGQDDRVHSKAPNQRHVPAHVSSTRFSHIEIPVHSFGFGESGGYSQEPAEDAFAKCVGGLLSVVVQDLRIQLSFVGGSTRAEITGVYLCNGRPTALNAGSIRLGDLYAEEERELLVELRAPASAVGTHHVMSVRCCYKDSATKEMVYGNEQALLVPQPHTIRSGPKIERLRNLFITTRAIAETRRLVEHGDMSSGHHLLSSARALAAEKLAKVAMMRKSMNKVSDLHGFENARF